ncbi:MAG: hypothetical protein LUG51_09115 [Tannerellaceae bacterium]|nr:hypothetical protein [Tannerellaceae bacterium]
MSCTEKYTIWFTVEVRHAYYGEGKIPLSIRLTEKMQGLFRKYNLMMRRWKQNEWIILSPETFQGIEETACLTLLITPSDPVFYYVSDPTLQTEDKEITYRSSTLPGIWKEVEIPQGNLPERITLTVPAKTNYWEILLFPSAEGNSYPLGVREKQNRVAFREMEKIQWLDGSTIFRICSQEKIPVQAVYTYQLRLIENREGKERVLSETLPVPRPEQLSVTGEKETITSYFNL